MNMLLVAIFLQGGLLGAAPAPAPQPTPAPPGFRALFNGADLTGWKVPEGDGGHWKVVDGVIDYDAESASTGEKSLFSEEAFGDFVLRLQWRLKDTPFANPRVPFVLPNGTHKKDAQGNELNLTVPDADSGVYIRGSSKAQVNIWNWPIGSGEVYGYRMDESMPNKVRAGVTPKENADRDIGQWNDFEITVRGDRLTVQLNGRRVLDKAQLPGLPAQGPIALQHHGDRAKNKATGKADGPWQSPPALVQFRNIFIKKLR